MRKSPPPAGVLFLLDWRPVFWSTREEYFRQLAADFSARGITPILVPSELNDPEVRRRFEAAGARVEPCSYHDGLWTYFRHIRRFQREYSLQFAHIRFFDYFSAVPWLSRLAGLDTIYFTEANSGEWNAQGLRRRIVHLRTAFMCRPVTAMIAISDFIRRRLVSVGVPESRITVVHNGVDTSSFRPNADIRRQLREQTGCTDATCVLLFAAVLLPWKRPEIAIEVCAELAARGVDVQLWVAGDGPLRAQLEQLALQRNVQRQVRWLGHQKEPQKWMAAADLFLHTAVGEAFGNVLVEAMASGLPVIATHSGAAEEIVQEGQTGRLIPAGPQEVKSLADAVSDTMRVADRYAQWSANAQRGATRFDTVTCVRKTLDFYQAQGGQP